MLKEKNIGRFSLFRILLGDGVGLRIGELVWKQISSLAGL